jgi:hypothetical protein
MDRTCRRFLGLRLADCLTLLCLAFLFVQGRAFGQVEEGSITGLVQDPTGAVVPKAEVSLLNTDQGITLQTRTDASGSFTFSPVRAGHYSITVTAQGFAKTTQTALTVNVAQSLQVNIVLKVGQATESVQVNTAPPLLQTEEASVGQVVGSQEINDLPLNSRNFTFLAQLGAGMQTPEADTRGNAANGAFSANGLRPAQNNYLLDGIDNNSGAVDFLNGTNYIILPPVDAIQEFKVESADFSAELGRAAGAVVNATVKSGTNNIHGAAWEFFRNDKLDAADYFENNTGVKKGELRKNQFGADIGGPIIKNKVFFFGDYEGNRRVQGTIGTGDVPTALERSSGYTNLTDIFGFNNGDTRPDLLGRQVQTGTVLDPATTRYVAAGATDPVTGLTNTSSSAGYVRDPFTSDCAGAKTFTQAACPDLNMLPSGRLDSNAVKLLNLYPAPNSGTQDFGSSPNLFEHSNEFDVRGDVNPSTNDQVFVRFSYSNDPQYIPGIFGGIADGGAFQQGIQNAKAQQAVAGYTHVFSPQAINEFRPGYAHLVTSRYGPEATNYGLPANYGIQGIQQSDENGGIPAFGVGGLLTLGSNSFLPSDEKTTIWQVNDDFTRIYGRHNFKTGIQYQRLKFSTLQPAWSHGQFDYDGTFVDIPNVSNTTGGIAQMLLTPAAAPATINGNANPNGFSYSGGPDNVYASNINTTYDERHYFAAFFQDDWKVTSKLTLNLGVRWDYFTPISETNGGQANIIPFGLPEYNIGAPTLLIPASGKDNRTLSTGHPLNPADPAAGESPGASCFGVGCWGLVDLLAQDGITLDVTNKYGDALVQDQKDNVAPRAGFAYQVMPKLVVRGGFGLFFNAFENQGYGPNIGENYPFVFNPDFTPHVSPTEPGVASQVAPVSYNTPYVGCANAGPGSTASFEAGFSCFSFNPGLYNALGLELEGMQFNFETPRTYSANLTLQYSITPTLAVQAAYVFTHGANLQVNQGIQNVTQLLPAGISTSACADSVKDYAVFPAAAGETVGSCIPFPDFGNSEAMSIGQSYYHGLQTKIEEQYSNGLTYLFTYTWSKTMSDAGDLLNGGSTGGYRAYNIPGLGPMFDWSLANFDVRQVLHFSGGYELPFGKGKRYMNQGGVANAVLGGWASNWILTLQGGQPVNFGCPTGTASGSGCNVLLTGNPKLGITTHTPPGDTANRPFWIGNAAAFNQPCELGDSTGSLAPIAGSPSGCLPLTGASALGTKPGQIPGPGFHRLDFSVFKDFQFTERIRMQFRSEFYNIVNHPNFNAPNFGGNGVVAIGGSGNITDPHFGELGGTRDAPYDPRQIQFALKLYY